MTCARPVRTRRGIRPCGRQAVALYTMPEAPVPLCRRHERRLSRRLEERVVRVEGVAT